MSLLYPFAALRPEPQAAAAVAAVPYDVVTTGEARALAAGNPLSFLHVSRPEIDLPDTADQHGEEAYAQAVRSLHRLISAAPLVVEDRPSLYVYRLQMRSHVQAGVAGCFSLDEYDRGLIRKHETTRPDKEDDRTRHMLTIGAQTGPVFLIYRHAREVDVIVARIMTGELLFDVTAPDAVRHEVWRASQADERALIDAFRSIPNLYIADGHHRAASAARARQSRSAQGAGEHDRLLAVAFPDDQVQVLPYNRVVRDLNGHAPHDLLAGLRRRLGVRDGGPATPVAQGEVAMYLAGRWHTLSAPASREPVSSGVQPALDVLWLQDDVLSPFFGVQDARTDPRIEFVGGIQGTDALERAVDSGRFAVAFSLVPVSPGDLMRVADAGGVMPPKSTWFEPKLRDGLLSHLL